MSIGPEQIRMVVISVFVLVVSVAFHEFGHAIMADMLGDDTPRRQGRVTLNPVAHADPIGTLLLPAIAGLYLGGAGFGWGKPVQWQPSRIDRKWRIATANILVSFAGPFMNIVLAILLAGIASILLHSGVITRAGEAHKIFGFAVITNFVLFFFNLIPAPPLDGGHIALAFTPYKYRESFDSYARFGPFIVLAVAAIPQIANIFLIPAAWCGTHVLALFGAL